LPAKKPYPRVSDIEDAILAVLSENLLIHPGDFPSAVREKLEEKGFCTIHVNTKRIWRVYESAVRAGRMPDYLDVVKS